MFGYCVGEMVFWRFCIGAVCQFPVKMRRVVLALTKFSDKRGVWHCLKRIQRYLKSQKNHCKVSANLFIFSTTVGLHVASLLKIVTHPSQVFYKEIV